MLCICSLLAKISAVMFNRGIQSTFFKSQRCKNRLKKEYMEITDSYFLET